MQIVYIFIAFIIGAWLYSIVVTEPPYGLEETPKRHYDITVRNVNFPPPPLE